MWVTVCVCCAHAEQNGCGVGESGNGFCWTTVTAEPECNGETRIELEIHARYERCASFVDWINSTHTSVFGTYMFVFNVCVCVFVRSRVQFSCEWLCALGWYISTRIQSQRVARERFIENFLIVSWHGRTNKSIWFRLQPHATQTMYMPNRLHSIVWLIGEQELMLHTNNHHHHHRTLFRTPPRCFYYIATRTVASEFVCKQK